MMAFVKKMETTVKNACGVQRIKKEEKKELPWFVAKQQEFVRWDRQEFLESENIQFLLKENIITANDLNTLRRGDIQKLDLAVDAHAFSGNCSMTKDQILKLNTDDVLRLQNPLFAPEKNEHDLDFMQRETLKASQTVQKLFFEKKITIQEIATLDVEDFAKFDLKSVHMLFSEGTLSVEDIKNCSLLDCGKFNVPIVQEALREKDLKAHQILWDGDKNRIIGVLK